MYIVHRTSYIYTRAACGHCTAARHVQTATHHLFSCRASTSYIVQHTRISQHAAHVHRTCTSYKVLTICTMYYVHSTSTCLVVAVYRTHTKMYAEFATTMSDVRTHIHRTSTRYIHIHTRSVMYHIPCIYLRCTQQVYTLYSSTHTHTHLCTPHTMCACVCACMYVFVVRGSQYNIPIMQCTGRQSIYLSI